MSIQFLTPLAGLTRSTNINTSGAWSWIVWFRPDTDISAVDYATVLAKIDSGYANNIGVFSKQDGSNGYYLDIYNGSDHASTQKILTAGKWYPISYSKAGNFHLFSVSGIAIGSLTVDVSAITFIELLLGNDGSSVSNGTFKGFREWDATLTPDQFLREFNSQNPVHTANIRTNTPLVNNLLDTTINNNDWLTSGVEGVDYNFIADDPIPAGCVFSEAIDIGILPYSTTIDVKPTNVEFIFDKCYKYTAQAPEIYIGGWFFGNLTTYTPNYAVYSDAGITPYPADDEITAQNVRFQMPVIVPHTYWFGVLAQFTDLSFSTLTIDFLTAPRKAVPAGSGFINDDSPPFYSAVFSGIPGDDYNILRFIPFVITASEQGGDTLVNGNIIVQDDVANLVNMFSPKLEFLLTLPGVTANTGLIVRRTANGNAIYINGVTTTPHVHRSDKDGNILATTWNPTPSIISLAPNNDETILYYVENTGTGRVLRRWDLINNVALSNLAAGVTSYTIKDIMVLSDDSILVMYVSNTNMNILRYDPTGTLLNTYTIGDCEAGSIAFDFTDPDNYFLLRAQDLAFVGSTSIIRVKLSDGTQVRTNHVVFEVGVYQAAKTATPIAKFGVSLSCPFFPLQLSPLGAAGGIYKLTPNSSQYEPRRNDKLWLDVEAQTTEEVKIPDPFIESAAIGD